MATKKTPPKAALKPSLKKANPFMQMMMEKAKAKKGK